MRTKYFYAAAMAAMLASCSSDVFDGPQVDQSPQSHQPAVAGKTPVGFGVYTSRSISRAGVSGDLTTDLMKTVGEDANAAGFGVFAYYTDNLDYVSQSKPNFMYNQQVTSADGVTWSYAPVKYWPNEFGDNAQSKDEDKVSFFAYAPYVACDATTGTVTTDADWGITGFSKNNYAGDPIVKYIASFDPTKSVDLLYGTVHADSNPWNTLAGTQQNFVNGEPFIDVMHPALIDQTMKFNFYHALAQLNVKIDLDADITAHKNTAEAGVEAGTKVYVRSVTFRGFAMKGALNLNNEEVGVARWLNYNGQGELTLENAESVIVNDGRKNGKEGVTAAPNEKNIFLNPNIISDEGNTTEGVLGTYQNLFKPDYSDAVDPENPTADEKTAADNKYVMVIPLDDSEPLKVTIVYDVETTDANLSTTLSDGTKGSRVRNEITKEVDFGGYGLRSGRRHNLNLHLGMTSVKFDASVGGWASSTGGNTWLPDNVGNGNEGISNPGNMLGITYANGASVTSGGDGATSAEINGVTGTSGKNIMTVVTKGLATSTSDDETATADWMIENPNIAAIKATTAPSRGGTRGDIPEGYGGTVNGAHSIEICPVSNGVTTLHSTSADGKESTIVITVLAATLKINKTSINAYSFNSSSPADTTIVLKYDMPKGLTSDEPTPTLEIAEGSEDYISSVNLRDDGVIVITPVDNVAAAGSGTINVSDTDGNSASITVNVKKPSITVTPASFNLIKGRTFETLIITGNNPAFDGKTYIKNVAVKTSDGTADLDGVLTYDPVTGFITAASDLAEDKEGKLVITYKGHDGETDPKAEVTFTVYHADLTDMKSDALSNNPLVKMAQYNVAYNGTSFVSEHSTNDQWGFTWDDAQTIAVPGYHVPSRWEFAGIVPGTIVPSVGSSSTQDWINTAAVTPKAFNSIYSEGGTEEKGWYLYSGSKNNIYAVRLINGLLTAWHYKWATSPCNGLKIESYVLAMEKDDNDTWSDDLMKRILSVLPQSPVWDEAGQNVSPDELSNESSLAMRFLPAIGRTQNGQGSAVTTFNPGQFTYYWGSTDYSTGGKDYGFGIYFASGSLWQRFVTKDSGWGSSVRLFKNND